MDDTPDFQEMDDNLPTIDHDTLDEILYTLQPPSPPPESDTNVVTASVEAQTSANTASVSTHPTPDSEDTQPQFQRTAVGLQRDLLREVHLAVNSVGGTLQAILRSLNSEPVNLEEEQPNNNQTPGLVQSLANISGKMRRRHEQMPTQSGTREVAKHLEQIYEILRGMQQKQDTYLATMSSYHRDLLAVLSNQQILISALMPNILSQGNAIPQTSSGTAVGLTPHTQSANTEPTEQQAES